MSRRAFTLVEVIATAAILLILLAITLPALAGSKKQSRKAVTLSNLRQCGMALELYEQDNGDLPPFSGAKEALEFSPTCDPADYWRHGCKEEFGAPLVGSYAYVRSLDMVSLPEDWQFYRKDPSATLMACIFHSHTQIVAFHGEQPDFTECHVDGASCAFPDTVVRLRFDGSAAITHKRINTTTGAAYSGPLMTWSSVFAAGQ